MAPETGYPIKPSSNTDDKDGLSDPSEDPWRPDRGDENPSVTITVDTEEDKFIESVIIDDTKNVESVTVVIVNEDGSEVCGKECIS